MNKRKNKVGKILILIVVMLLAIVVGSIISHTKEEAWQRYSVTNHLGEGYGAIFETLKTLDLQVKRTYAKPSELPSEGCQVIVALEDESQLEAWVEAGGIVVDIAYEEEDTIPIIIETQGLGKWITIYGRESLTNKKLKEDTEIAYEVYKTLAQEAGERTIYFNEYYLSNQTVENFKLWHMMPDYVKAMAIQLGIALILYFCYKGKRFGKVMSLPEEEERTENEYVYAAADLYRKAGAWDLVVHNYYEVLLERLRRLTRQEGDFLSMWHQEALPDFKIAEEVNTYMLQLESLGQVEKCTLNKKQVQPIIEKITYLIKQVDQRREAYWKQ